MQRNAFDLNDHIAPTLAEQFAVYRASDAIRRILGHNEVMPDPKLPPPDPDPQDPWPDPSPLPEPEEPEPDVLDTPLEPLPAYFEPRTEPVLLSPLEERDEHGVAQHVPVDCLHGIRACGVGAQVQLRIERI